MSNIEEDYQTALAEIQELKCEIKRIRDRNSKLRVLKNNLKCVLKLEREKTAELYKDKHNLQTTIKFYNKLSHALGLEAAIEVMNKPYVKTIDEAKREIKNQLNYWNKSVDLSKLNLFKLVSEGGIKE